MTHVVLAVLALTFHFDLSEDVNWVEILSFLLLIFLGKFSKNAHQNVPDSVLVMQTQKILFLPCHQQMIESIFINLIFSDFFGVYGEMVLSELVFFDL